MEIIQAKSIEESKKLIEKARKEGKEVIVKGRDIEFNRKILEMKRVSALVLNLSGGRDGLKQRDSGLNQVLCRIAKDNNITLAIDFNELLVEDKKQKAKILGRMIQNIKLIKKFKNKLEIVNKPSDKLSLSAFLRILGADTKMASDASQ
jgi:RNase P/RNase MRP subunit p30